MRTLQLLLIILAFTMLGACGGQTSGEISSDILSDSTGQANRSASANDLSPSHNCTIANEVMEGNQFWFREKSVLVAITADSSTLDPDLGPSHRVLEVYNTDNCEQIQRVTLPVNLSPDFPYFLAEITYNKESELIGIRGARKIFIYDVSNRRLLAGLSPQFLNRRLAEDAQSGNILRLEVWENFLIGYAEDEGTFAFDLRQADAPVPVLPIAEYRIEENEYVPLFGFPSSDGKVQLVLPAYNHAAGRFSIHPLYDSPQDISLTLPAGAQNNRFIILRSNDARHSAVAVDLLNRQLVDLPDNMLAQPTQVVLQWVRQHQ